MPERKSSGSLALRAATNADRFAIEPPEVRIPRASSPYPNRSQSQRITLFSIWAPTGAWPHMFTNRLIPVARKSPSADAYSPPPGMNGRKPGPVVL